MRYIGDVHGKMDEYLEIINGCEESIQVGDFGVGFVPVPQVPNKHRFIRGNHDSPGLCRLEDNWIEDGIYDGIHLFIGGAYSIDQSSRIPGISWWADEELGWEELNRIIDTVPVNNPRIIVSHDAPKYITNQLFPFARYASGSRTQNALDAIFEIHKPEIWIVGHWHSSHDVVIDGTRFIFLNELEYIDL